jgi:hypothetical protein
MASRGTCTECGGTHKIYVERDMEWRDCPYCDEQGNTILRFDKALAPVASLAVAKFDKDTNPKNHSPRAALEKALLAYDEAPDGEKPDHIIVCVGWNYAEKNLSGTTYYQAGKYAHHGQMGLMFEAQHMIRESSD